MPMILATGAVHSHLVRQGLRTFTSLNVRSGECLDLHYFAVLIGVGATTVNAYLAQDSIADRHAPRPVPGPDPRGVPRPLQGRRSTRGCSRSCRRWASRSSPAIAAATTSRRSACRARWCAEYFPGMLSRISGIGLTGIQSQVRRCTARLRGRRSAAADRRLLQGTPRRRAPRLGGRRSTCCSRPSRPDSYDDLQAVRRGDAGAPPIAIRDLLDFEPARQAGPDRRGRVDHRDPQALRDAGHVAGRAFARGAQDADHRHEPDRRQVRQRRGRRGPGRFKPEPNGDNANSAIKQVASGRSASPPST